MDNERFVIVRTQFGESMLAVRGSYENYESAVYISNALQRMQEVAGVVYSVESTQDCVGCI